MPWRSRVHCNHEAYIPYNFKVPVGICVLWKNQLSVVICGRLRGVSSVLKGLRNQGTLKRKSDFSEDLRVC